MKVNKIINTVEQKMLDFFLERSTVSKERFYQQILSSHVIRDSSPYFYILNFDINKDDVSPFTADGSYVLSVAVYYSSNSAPTILELQIVNGYIHMFEMFNADSSVIDYEKMYKESTSYEVIS